MNLTLKLPAEVLSCIFDFARLFNPVPSLESIWQVKAETETERQQLSPTSLSTFKLAWLCLTHVCSRWRTISLNDKALWTEVPASIGVRWLQEFMIRSGEQAVSIDWHSVNWGYPQERTQPERFALLESVFDIAQKHHRRLRNFKAFLRPTDMLLPILSRPWPKLEELEIWLTGDYPPFALLANHAPHLRHLVLCASWGYSCVDFPWNAPFLDALTLLDLHFTRGIDGESMVTFIDALDRMSGLEHLHLGNTPPLDANEGPPYPPALAQCNYCRTGAPRVQNVALKTLALQCDRSMAYHIMRHIRPPPTVRVWVDSEQYDDGLENTTEESLDERVVDSWQKVCAMLWQWRCGPDKDTTSRAFVTLNVVITSDWRTDLLLTSKLGFPREIWPVKWYKGVDGVHPELKLSAQFPHSAESAQFFFLFLCEVLETLRADHIRFLYIDSNKEHSSTEFPCKYLTSAVFQHVEVLCLQRPSLFFLKCLSMFGNVEEGEYGSSIIGGSSDKNNANSDIAFLSDDPSKDTLFPALRRLELNVDERAIHSFVPALQKLTSIRRNLLVDIGLYKVVDTARREPTAGQSHPFEGGDEAVHEDIDILEAMKGIRITRRVVFASNPTAT